MSAGLDPPVKKRRLQSGKACSSCRQKKYRCDGGRPSCSNCTSRGITCEYAATGIDLLPATQLESIVASERGQSQVWRSWDRPEASELSGIRPRDLQELPGLGQPRGFVTAASPHVGPPVESKELEGYFGNSSTLAFVSGIRSNLESSLPPSIESLPSVAQNPPCRELESTTGNPAQCPDEETPPYTFLSRELGDELVDAYFDRVHVFYPFVHEGDFRTRYEQKWNSEEPSWVSKTTWNALVNLVFAHGCEFASTKDKDAVSQASMFEIQARNIILSTVFERSDMSLVQALLLLCHYLQGTLRLNECWNFVGLTIRTAQSLGLHLDPSKETSFASAEKEIRKRVWWACFILDRTLSMKLGRPPSILTASAFRVPFPSEVDDMYVVEGASIPRQPKNRPSYISFFVQTIKLVQIVDKILDKMYLTNHQMDARETEKPLDPSRISSIILGNTLLLEGELQSWWENTPEHLRPDTKLCENASFKRQSKVNLLRFLQMRLLLHRPALMIFARSIIDEGLLYDVAVASSKVCVSVAYETIDLIHTQYSRGSLNSVWYIVHYLFTSLGVLLTVQLLGPSKINSIGYNPDPVALERGMEILKKSSFTSTLAANYISMLERLRDNSNLNTVDIVPSFTESNRILDIDFMDSLDFLMGTGLS